MEPEEIVDGFIEQARTESKDSWPAWKAMDDAVRNNPDRAWEMILGVLEKDKSDIVMENLAAGPLEDLLVNHGDDVIERVEQTARRSPDFNRLLGGVWKNAISEDVWARVLQVRNRTW